MYTNLIKKCEVQRRGLWLFTGMGLLAEGNHFAPWH